MPLIVNTCRHYLPRGVGISMPPLLHRLRNVYTPVNNGNCSSVSECGCSITALPSPADPSPALRSPLAPALCSAGSLTFCQPEDNAGLLTSRKNRERSFPPRAEAEHSPSCSRCCLIWGPRSCCVLGLALKLCDSCLQQAPFFTPLSFLGDLRHLPGLLNFLLHEAPASPVQKRERLFSLKCLNSWDTF